MGCFAGETKWTDLIDKHFSDIRKPFVAGIELWPECNFKCVHCYAESERTCNAQTMSKDQVFFVIDTLVKHDCLELFLTGGEVLLKDDFFDIYMYAKKQGLLVSVLTNGSLINQKHIDLWKTYPPELISLTMYGASEETYKNVTKCANGYSMFVNAVRLLSDNGIPFEIKCIGIKQNYHDIPKIREFGRELGKRNALLAWDIRPMTDGNMEPIDCRVTPEEAVQIETSDSERRAFWQSLANNPDRNKPTKRQSEGYLYPCGIAHQFVFITHDGKMQGCVKAVKHQYNLLAGNFDEGWDYLGEVLMRKKATPAFACTTCKHFRYCAQCTAAFEDENDDPEKPVDFYCRFGELCDAYMTERK